MEGHRLQLTQVTTVRLDTELRLAAIACPSHRTPLNDKSLTVDVCPGSLFLRRSSAITVEDISYNLPLPVDIAPDHDILADVLHRAFGARD